MSIGCRALAAHDPVQGVPLSVHVLYPTDAPARAMSLGPYALDAAPDGPIVTPGGARLPVVALSHGNGGSPWGYAGLTAHVAQAGFAVLMIAHAGNTRGDNALADTPANLANRPRHVRVALDAAFADAALGPHLARGTAETAAPRGSVTRGAVAVIGHSIGGYTALAVAGGHPIALPNQTPDGVARPIAIEADPRVRAAVLLAPALPWLMAPGALDDVRAPLFVRTCERDEVTPPAFTERVLAGLPAGAPLDYRVVPGAGHFPFYWPVPPSMVSPLFPPSQDPPGFDRAAYQPILCAEVVAFLRAHLV